MKAKKVIHYYIKKAQVQAQPVSLGSGLPVFKNDLSGEELAAFALNFNPNIEQFLYQKMLEAGFNPQQQYTPQQLQFFLNIYKEELKKAYYPLISQINPVLYKTT